MDRILCVFAVLCVFARKYHAKGEFRAKDRKDAKMTRGYRRQLFLFFPAVCYNSIFKFAVKRQPL